MTSEMKLPDKIYLIDPFDDDGQPVKNTEDVCWCADPAGSVNVGYIAEATVAAALEELRASFLKKKIEVRDSLYSDPSCEAESDYNERGRGVISGTQGCIDGLDATIAKLGIGGTEETK